MHQPQQRQRIADRYIIAASGGYHMTTLLPLNTSEDAKVLRWSKQNSISNQNLPVNADFANANSTTKEFIVAY